MNTHMNNGVQRPSIHEKEIIRNSSQSHTTISALHHPSTNIMMRTKIKWVRLLLNFLPARLLYWNLLAALFIRLQAMQQVHCTEKAYISRCSAALIYTALIPLSGQSYNQILRKA